MQRLRLSKGSNLAALVAEKGNLSGSRENAIVSVAWGNLLGVDRLAGFVSPFSMEAAVKISEAITPVLQHGKMTNPNVSIACSAGQLAATWIVKESTTLVDTQVALNKVAGLLKSNPMTAGALSQVFNYVIAEARKYSGDDTMISQAEAEIRLGVQNDQTFTLNLPAQVNIQKLRMIELGANAIPDSFFIQQATKDFWRNLVGNWEVNLLIPDDVDLDIVGDVERGVAWRECTLMVYSALYNISGVRENNELLTRALSYLILSLLQLTKNSNVTDNYIDRKLDQISKEFSNLSLSNYLSRDAVLAFGSMFPITRLSVDEVYAILSTYYTVFSQAEIGPMKWIIEQAAAANVSSALAVAEMISKHRGATYDKIANLIGRDQFATWARLVGSINYDRYSTIIAPEITIAEYADLAYLGIRVSFGSARTGVAGGGYQGKPDTRAKLAKSDLDRIAEQIISQSALEVDEKLSVIGDLRARFANHTVLDINGEFFVIPAAAGAADAADLREARQRVEDIEQRATRADWPRALRQAPHGTRKFTLAQALDDLRANTPGAEWHTALLDVAEQMIAVSRQETLTLIPDNRLNSLQRRTRVPDALITSIQLLGADTPNEWSVDPEPIAAVGTNVNAMHVNQYIKTWWPNHVVEPAVVVGPAPNNQAGRAAQAGGVNNGQQVGPRQVNARQQAPLENVNARL